MTIRPTTRAISVPGDYPSLAAALDAASPGDTVMLMGTTHEQTPVRCADGVTIEAIAGVELRGPGDRPVLVIEAAEHVRIFGLRLAHDGGGDASLCEVRGATVEMRHCTFANGGAHGLLATEGAKLRLKRCAFVQNAGDGLHLDGVTVHAEVMDCSAADNAGFGVRAVAGGDAYMERLAARANGSGVFASGGATKVTCRMGVIEANRGAGFVAEEGATLRLEANTISENAGAGVAASGAATNLVARRNAVACNAGDGFSIGAGVVAMLDGNTCGGNVGAGIELLGPGTRAEIFANECVENGRGIVAASGIGGLVEDNVCDGNRADDFSVRGDAVRLVRNRVGRLASASVGCGPK